MRLAVPAALLLGCISTFAASQAVSSPDSQTGIGAGVGVIMPRPRPAALGRITGHVLCDDTRRPARGALVIAEPLPSADGTSPGGNGMNLMTHVATDGTYTLEHISPGEYTVFAFTPGYLLSLPDIMDPGAMGSATPAQRRELLARNGTVSVSGTDTATFDITLHRGAAISGRVLYSDGAPASQITLVLEDVNAKSKGAKTDQNQEFMMAMANLMLTHQNYSTDDQGRFRLVGIQPGTYRVAAAQPVGGYAETSDAEGRGQVMVLTGMADPHALRFYAGDTPHPATAKTFDLRAGDEVTGVDITLPLDSLHQLHGTVTARDGRIINMGQVTLTDNTDPNLVFHANLNRDGTFSIPQVPSGNYSLAVSNAQIGKPLTTNANIPENFAPLQPTNSFADNSVNVLVKDADLLDLSLTVDEVPLSRGTTTPNSGDPQ